MSQRITNRGAVRWPLAPLAEQVGPDVARSCRVSGATHIRWAAEGLGDEEADRVAVSLGLNPENIWEHWLDDEAGRLVATLRWQTAATA